MKKISIIIPCYNVEKYILRCIDSLAAQTIGMDGLELIFVNDCSEDATLELLLQKEKKHESSITVINCGQHGGPGAARNLGMSYATAPYIGFVDGDDFVTSDMYERLYEKAEKYPVDFVVCGWQKVAGDEPLEADMENERLFDFKDLALKKKTLGEEIWNTSVCTKLYRKEFLEKNRIGFPEGVFYEDTFFSYLVYAHMEKVYYVNKKMYCYFYNPKSIMRGGSLRSQLDRILSCEQLWQELGQRGLRECYYTEWEIIFIRKYFAEVMNLLVLLFDEIPYNIYTHMCDFMKCEFPKAAANPYLELPRYKFERLYISTMNLSPEQLAQVQRLLKENISNGGI